MEPYPFVKASLTRRASMSVSKFGVLNVCFSHYEKDGRKASTRNARRICSYATLYVNLRRVSIIINHDFDIHLSSLIDITISLLILRAFPTREIRLSSLGVASV